MIVNQIINVLKKLFIVNIYVFIFFIVSFNVRAEIMEKTLDNGLNIILKKDRRAPVVTSHVWYKIGSADEISGKTGLSHALEHMMFKGTKKNPGGQFSQIISKLGGKVKITLRIIKHFPLNI